MKLTALLALALMSGAAQSPSPQINITPEQAANLRADDLEAQLAQAHFKQHVAEILLANPGWTFSEQAHRFVPPPTPPPPPAAKP